MSSGLECHFVTLETNEVFYVLQDYSCPVGAWDWREYAKAFGPFASEEAAEAHLYVNHANPGGGSSYDHKSGSDPVLDRLIASARASKSTRRRW